MRVVDHVDLAAALENLVAAETELVDLLTLLDASCFCLPLGEAVARVGCHVYGCCWGRPTGTARGLCYHSPDAKVVRCKPHLRGVPLHPAQLYGALSSAVLFAVFLYGVDLYNHGYLWEAHEAWEGLWHQAKRDALQAEFLQGLIQCAAAALKVVVEIEETQASFVMEGGTLLPEPGSPEEEAWKALDEQAGAP